MKEKKRKEERERKKGWLREKRKEVLIKDKWGE